MFRVYIAAFMLLVALAACNGDSQSTPTGSPAPDGGSSGPPVTAVARPPSVPATALEIEQDTTLGRIVRQANETPQRIETRALLTAACQDGVMVIWTEEETIYAELPCDRFWDDDTVQVFSSQEVAVVLTVDATRFQIFIETVPGGQAEFTVGGIWLE